MTAYSSNEGQSVLKKDSYSFDACYNVSALWLSTPWSPVYHIAWSSSREQSMFLSVTTAQLSSGKVVVSKPYTSYTYTLHLESLSKMSTLPQTVLKQNSIWIIWIFDRWTWYLFVRSPFQLFMSPVFFFIYLCISTKIHVKVNTGWQK